PPEIAVEILEGNAPRFINHEFDSGIGRIDRAVALECPKREMRPVILVPCGNAYRRGDIFYDGPNTVGESSLALKFLDVYHHGRRRYLDRIGCLLVQHAMPVYCPYLDLVYTAIQTRYLVFQKYSVCSLLDRKVFVSPSR